MKPLYRDRKSKNPSNKSIRLISSTSNSAFATRNASPTTSYTVRTLQNKINELENKLNQAQSTIIQKEQERKYEKRSQNEFLEVYHTKMLSLQQFNDKNSNDSDLDDKIIKEREALEEIWQRRYDEMKIFYEKKITELKKNENLCSKCKAFLRTSDEVNKKLKYYRLHEDSRELKENY